MSDIFREVDEDVRRDRALQFWTKYQSLFIGIAVLVVLATASWRIYQSWRLRMAEASSAHYERALDQVRNGEQALAMSEFKRLEAKGAAGYKMLARLRAAAETGKSDPAAGAAAFDAVAADGSLPQPFQDLARLRAAVLLLDTADPKDIRSRLEPLAVPGGTFRHTARELLALSALKNNDPEAASKWLDAILRDPTTPADVSNRAEALLGLVKGAKPATG